MGKPRVRHRPSERLSSLVDGRVQRTYLTAIDGYWADAVLAAFTALDDLDYRVEVSFHQKGDYVSYDGRRGRIWAYFEPDGGPAIIDCRFDIDGAYGPVEELARRPELD